MHIVIAVVGLLGAAALWWWRFKAMGEAANEVASQVGKVQGHFRRQKLRKKAAVSPIAAIDDPVVAAATVMVGIGAEDMVNTDALVGRVQDAIERIAPSKAKATEAVTYAKWATDQVADVPVVIDLSAKFLADKLDEAEKEQLVAMVQSVVVKEERHQMYAQRIDRLRRKLGLVGTQ